MGAVEAQVREYYDTVAPADATTLAFFKENLAILGGVTDVPDRLGGLAHGPRFGQERGLRLPDAAG